MATSYPGTLPQTPLQQSYNVSRQDALVRTSMDAGAPRVRRRFTDAARYLVCAFIYEDDEMAAFNTWYEGALEHGAAWFDMYLDMGDGAGPARKWCRLRRDPTVASQACKRWYVALDMEVHPYA